MACTHRVVPTTRSPRKKRLAYETDSVSLKPKRQRLPAFPLQATPPTEHKEMLEHVFEAPYRAGWSRKSVRNEPISPHLSNEWNGKEPFTSNTHHPRLQLGITKIRDEWIVDNLHRNWKLEFAKILSQMLTNLETASSPS